MALVGVKTLLEVGGGGAALPFIAACCQPPGPAILSPKAPQTLSGRTSSAATESISGLDNSPVSHKWTGSRAVATVGERLAMATTTGHICGPGHARARLARRPLKSSAHASPTRSAKLLCDTVRRAWKLDAVPEPSASLTLQLSDAAGRPSSLASARGRLARLVDEQERALLAAYTKQTRRAERDLERSMAAMEHRASLEFGEVIGEKEASASRRQLGFEDSRQHRGARLPFLPPPPRTLAGRPADVHKSFHEAKVRESRASALRLSARTAARTPAYRTRYAVTTDSFAEGSEDGSSSCGSISQLRRGRLQTRQAPRDLFIFSSTLGSRSEQAEVREQKLLAESAPPAPLVLREKGTSSTPLAIPVYSRPLVRPPPGAPRWAAPPPQPRPRPQVEPQRSAELPPAPHPTQLLSTPVLR